MDRVLRHIFDSGWLTLCGMSSWLGKARWAWQGRPGARHRRWAGGPSGKTGMSEAADELFLMTNLYPVTTGLPMVIWVGPSYGVAHDVRIKVSQTHSPRMDPCNLAVVAVRPAPHVVAGQLSTADLRAVAQWIALNEAAILDHWNGRTDGVQLGQRLRPLSPPIPP
jgi:hypothetical protein